MKENNSPFNASSIYQFSRQREGMIHELLPSCKGPKNPQEQQCGGCRAREHVGGQQV